MPDGSRSSGSGGGASSGRDQRARARSLHRPATRVVAGHAIIEKVNKVIETMIGKIARPRRILIVPDMPKTRSGKLMRRVLAAVSNNMSTGDITTLANPDAVEKVREMAQGKEAVAVADGPEDLKKFGTEE